MQSRVCSTRETHPNNEGGAAVGRQGFRRTDEGKDTEEGKDGESNGGSSFDLVSRGEFFRLGRFGQSVRTTLLSSRYPLSECSARVDSPIQMPTFGADKPKRAWSFENLFVSVITRYFSGSEIALDLGVLFRCVVVRWIHTVFLISYN